MTTTSARNVRNDGGQDTTRRHAPREDDGLHKGCRGTTRAVCGTAVSPHGSPALISPRAIYARLRRSTPQDVFVEHCLTQTSRDQASMDRCVVIPTGIETRFATEGAPLDRLASSRARRRIVRAPLFKVASEQWQRDSRIVQLCTSDRARIARMFRSMCSVGSSMPWRPSAG